MVKKLKKIAAVLMAVAICVVQPLGSVGLPANEPIVAEAASAAKLNRTKLTILKGKTYTLKLTGASGSVKWTSSKTSVARLAPSGKKCVVKGRKVGTSTVTAKVGTKKYKCKVTVVQPVTKVSLNKKSLSFTKASSKATLKASVKPSSAYKKTVKWSTSDKNVATVTSKGVVKPVANGTCTITATAKDGSGKKATCKVTVNIPGAAAAGSTGTGTSAGNTGGTSAGSTSEGTSGSTGSGSTSTGSGTGSGSGSGSSTPTVTVTPTPSPSPTPTAVKVTSITVREIHDSFDAASSSLEIANAGEKLYLKSQVLPSNAKKKSVTWSSSNTSVATVDQSGTVTAVASGKATITATADDGSGVKGSVVVSVNIPVKATSITLSTTSVSLTKAGETAKITATVLPSNASNKSVTWYSSKTSVATVSQDGTITAVADGTANIYAMAKDGSGVKSGNVEVAVNLPPDYTSPGAIDIAGARYSTYGRTSFEFRYANEYTKKLGVIRCNDVINSPAYDIIVVDDGIDLKAISYEITNKSGVVEPGADADEEYITTSHTFYFYGLLTGVSTVTFRHNGEVLYTCDINITSNDPDYASWVNWKAKILPQIWNDSMTLEEKLYAVAHYISDNFTYGSPGSNANPWEVMKTECTGATNMFCDIAREELGLQVGYVAANTGKVYNYISEAYQNNGGGISNHVYSAVFYDGKWYGYDACPLRS